MYRLYISVALRACEISPFPGTCETFEVLAYSNIYKNCPGTHFTRRRKRDVRDSSFRSRSLMAVDESDFLDNYIKRSLLEVEKKKLRIVKRATTE